VRVSRPTRSFRGAAAASGWTQHQRAKGSSWSEPALSHRLGMLHVCQRFRGRRGSSMDRERQRADGHPSRSRQREVVG
jgi:hypothetical protein